MQSNKTPPRRTGRQIKTTSAMQLSRENEQDRQSTNKRRKKSQLSQQHKSNSERKTDGRRRKSGASSAAVRSPSSSSSLSRSSSSVEQSQGSSQQNPIYYTEKDLEGISVALQISIDEFTSRGALKFRKPLVHVDGESCLQTSLTIDSPFLVVEDTINKLLPDNLCLMPHSVANAMLFCREEPQPCNSVEPFGTDRVKAIATNEQWKEAVLNIAYKDVDICRDDSNSTGGPEIDKIILDLICVTYDIHAIPESAFHDQYIAKSIATSLESMVTATGKLARALSGGDKNKVPTQVNIRVSNDENKSRKHDFHAHVSKDISLYDAVYENEGVRRAHLRKWKRETVQDLKSNDKQICAGICDGGNTDNTSYHFVYRGLESMKTTTMLQFYTALPKDAKGVLLSNYDPVHFHLFVEDAPKSDDDEDEF